MQTKICKYPNCKTLLITYEGVNWCVEHREYNHCNNCDHIFSNDLFETNKYCSYDCKRGIEHIMHGFYKETICSKCKIADRYYHSNWCKKCIETKCNKRGCSNTAGTLYKYCSSECFNADIDAAIKEASDDLEKYKESKKTSEILNKWIAMLEKTKKGGFYNG